MKCVVCRERAEIKTPRHNCAFCDEHFIKHIQGQVEKAIRKFNMFMPDSRVLLGVSGGKDSMVAWNILTEMGYQVQAVHLRQKFGEFSDLSEKVVREYADEEDVPLEVCSFEELIGAEFEVVRRLTGKTSCSVCGMAKRYYLNKLAGDLNCDVVVTGHNLDDETAVLFGNVLHWQEGYLQRQYPVYNAEGGMIKKAKPLARITDEEAAIYARVKDIPYLDMKCPESKGAKSHNYKDVLGSLQKDYPNIKAEFYFGFLERLSPVLKPQSSEEKPACISCGYNTINPSGLCNICMLKERISALDNSSE